MELLKKLCETPAIPGREQKIINLMKLELKETCDSVSVDAMGNVIGVKKSGRKNARKIMISAHMDEIGFIVTHVDDNGFIRLAPRGYHMPRTLCSQRVRILGKKDLVGVAEVTPSRGDPKKRDEVPKVQDMFVDTGLGKAVKKSVAVGDIVVLERSFLEQGDVYISKAFDDRIGCYMLIEAMKRVQKKKLPVDVYAVGSTQEEVGLRGAKGAAKDVVPDIGVALDVTDASDVPGVGAAQRTTELGKGVAIKINDAAAICNHGIVKYLQALAKKHKIKHQMEVLAAGGTDMGAMQLFGSGAVCALSIPTRYIHTPNEMISKQDLKASVDLLVRFLETADKCKLEF
jgi:endoglucanase